MSKYEYCCSVLEEIILASKVRGVTVKLLLAVDRKNFDTFDETVGYFVLMTSVLAFDSSFAGSSDN